VLKFGHNGTLDQKYVGSFET